MPSKKPLPLYTKTGDAGTSQTASGFRLPKHHQLFHVLGNLDELNSALGLAGVIAPKEIQPELHQVQHHLLNLGAIIAGSTHTQLNSSELTFLENRIDFYQAHTRKDWYTSFLLPGGSELAARLDLARAICRRTERSLIRLQHTTDFTSLKIGNWKLIIAYTNRLSDYLFALRCFSNAKLQVSEIKFHPSSKKP